MVRNATRVFRPVEEIRPCDVTRFPPGEKHRHGATAPMAIMERLDGKNNDWMEQGADERSQARKANQ
jgi:hypothetical protein